MKLMFIFVYDKKILLRNIYNAARINNTISPGFWERTRSRDITA